MGPTWGRQDPGGPHVGPMNLAIREGLDKMAAIFQNSIFKSILLYENVWISIRISQNFVP